MIKVIGIFAWKRIGSEIIILRKFIQISTTTYFVVVPEEVAQLICLPGLCFSLNYSIIESNNLGNVCALLIYVTLRATAFLQTFSIQACENFRTLTRQLLKQRFLYVSVTSRVLSRWLNAKLVYPFMHYGDKPNAHIWLPLSLFNFCTWLASADFSLR